jgi:hypothetical protein
LWSILFVASRSWDARLFSGNGQSALCVVLFAAWILWDGPWVRTVTMFFSTTKANIAETLFQVVYFGALGAGIGLVFWLIARPDKHAGQAVEISN